MAILDAGERVDGFRLVAPDEAEEFFHTLTTHDQLDLLQSMVPAERRIWTRLLQPDDAADLIQDAARAAPRPALLGPPSTTPRASEVRALLAYQEEAAGGLMSPRYARVRPDMTVDEAILYMRRQASQNLETIYYGYVLDLDVLLGVVSFRDLFQAPGNASVRDVMHTELVTVAEDMDQEAVGLVMDQHNLMALPVVDAGGRMKGIVTLDDIVDVVQRGGHRGHPEDRRHRGPRRALPRGRRPARWSAEARRSGSPSSSSAQLLTVRRDRPTTRASIRATAVLRALFIPLDHLERRQLGLAGRARS